MKYTFNSKSITIKVDSKVSYNSVSNSIQYDKSKTELRADSLTCALLSTNPLRDTYTFTDDDYIFIAQKRDEIESILNDIDNRLNIIKD